jgi:hypothetical protein
MEWDTGAAGKVSSATIQAMIEEGLSADDVFVGNQAGDARGALANAANTVTAEYSYPLSESRADGADEHHGDLARGPLRGVGADAERRVGAGGGGQRRGPVPGTVRGAQDHPRRRFRPPRHA